jgi:hypothetical protein
MVIKMKMICMNKKLLTFALGLLATMGIISGVVLSDVVNVSTDVSPYITATFQYSAVSYGTLSTDTHDTTAPDQASGVYNVTVDTNANYKVSGSGTVFDDGAGHTFAIGNLKMDTDTNPASFSNTTAVTLTGAPQVIDTGMTPSDTVNYHGYYISIPAAQYAASYSSNVTVTLASV